VSGFLLGREKEQQELGKRNRGGEQAGLRKKKERVEEANKLMAGGVRGERGGGRIPVLRGQAGYGRLARLAEKQSKEKKKRREKKKNSSLKTQER